MNISNACKVCPTVTDFLLPPLRPLQDEIVKVQRRQEEERQFLARERAIAEGAELDKKEELVSWFGAFGIVSCGLLPPCEWSQLQLVDSQDFSSCPQI